ncbi:urease accessory protein UreF [Glutamicibacter sp.]|uniref:urease accessory protein UreF n=1 Tax=Glutamicibacter sp. TaxID=1931995 RepID=UPI0028BF1F0E|nr:urease accessory protein UreF [Glutamicibacter sp.]
MPNTPTSSAHLLTLLQLADSALPTGAFSHSFGLESYLETGQVHDEDSFLQWLKHFLDQSLVYTDGLVVRLAYEAEQLQDVFYLDQLAIAAALPREMREAATKIGTRMLSVANMVFPSTQLQHYSQAIEQGRCFGHPGIGFALAAKAAQAPLPDVLSSYLFSTLTSLTQNAIRAIPLGQNAGQRVLAAMHAPVAGAVQTIYTLNIRDVGAAAPGLEIAQMRHEHQRARMFMS